MKATDNQGDLLEFDKVHISGKILERIQYEFDILRHMNESCREYCAYRAKMIKLAALKI